MHHSPSRDYSPDRVRSVSPSVGRGHDCDIRVGSGPKHIAKTQRPGEDKGYERELPGKHMVAPTGLPDRISAVTAGMKTAAKTIMKTVDSPEAWPSWPPREPNSPGTIGIEIGVDWIEN